MYRKIFISVKTVMINFVYVGTSKKPTTKPNKSKNSTGKVT